MGINPHDNNLQFKPVSQERRLRAYVIINRSPVSNLSLASCCAYKHGKSKYDEERQT